LDRQDEHAAVLVPRIQEMLREVDLDANPLSGILVGAGPGSFTGVRVAAATGKGLPLWAFSSLASAAAGVEGESLHPRMVLFDARGDRVYAAAYRMLHGRSEEILAPTATTISQVLEELVPPGSVLMGDGATRHRDLLESAGVPILPPPAGHPSADGLLRLLAMDPGAAPLEDPGRWEPEYLRESGAERMWKTGRSR
jgi:tRNA threonylcarbamoyl adenosine modification protein YeaZ